MKIDPTTARDRLTDLPGWRVEGDELVKIFTFKDFAQAFAFMAAVAPLAEKLNHHPEWTNVYNRVTVRLTTHDEGGLSELDFELAKWMNEVAQA